MANLFSDLEEFGLSKFTKMEIYAKDETLKNENKRQNIKKETIREESQYLFQKTLCCPVCQSEFKAKTVKTGKAKLIDQDLDLRPRYRYVNPLKYDALLCPHCGYAAITRYFDKITYSQSKLIREKISAHYKNQPTEGDCYSYEEAIIRHKLALLSSVVMGAKSSQKAYVCLKLAWLYRFKIEELSEIQPINELEKQRCKKLEMEFLTKAYEGFTQAFSKESFPLCGMDEYTFMYLVAELARRTKHYEESKRMLSRVLTARTTKERIKEKAREVKELLKNVSHEEEEKAT